MVLEFIAGAAVGGLLSSGGTHTRVETHTVPYVKEVHEHRAPTDDSVKLLREMEDAARKQIHGAFVTKSNEFTGAVIHTAPSIMGGHDIYVRFKLNGKTYETKHILSDMDMKFDKEGALKMLFASMSEEIARQMLVKAIGAGKLV